MSKNIFFSALAAICFLYETGSAQWVQSGMNTGVVYTIANDEEKIYAGMENGVFISTDDGSNWAPRNNFPIGWTPIVMSLVIKDTNIFAATWGPGVFLSNDNGVSWTGVNSGLIQNGINSMVLCNDGSILVGTVGNGVYRSTDNGQNWTSALVSQVYSMVIEGDTVYTGGLEGVHRSSDNGLNWDDANIGLPAGAYVRALAISNGNIYAGTVQDGVYRSEDVDLGWTAICSGLPDNGSGGYMSIVALAVYGNSLFAGSTGKGIYCSNDYGASWNTANTGLTSTNLRALKVHGDTIYAGTYNGGIWLRPLSEIITAVNEKNITIPARISLEQNFPNPFNPSTNITFSISNVMTVDLRIFDILGREVVTLVNGIKAPGTHTVEWNGKNSAGLNVGSGIYFYKLSGGHAGEYSETKKLVLVK